MQDGDAITGPRLLYYTKGIPTAVLSNVLTLINWVNGAKYISVSIIPDNDDMFNLWLADN